MEQNSLITIDFSMVIQMINFLIMVYVFYKLFSKKIGGIIEQRRNIATQDLEKVKIEQEKLEEQKKIVDKLRRESKKRANDIIIKAEIQADNRKEQIINNANISKERMMANAENEIIKMRAKAELELQKEVGEIAIKIAEKIIKENVSENQDLQVKSVDNFINEIGE
ncbi:F0F1 ATP synthase subunit B [Oceanivirga miroungae]|uniref:ATP synthase subunit b n=1 Tax=Oceanivirga miroungae TaxID=1130046 RepID=A0A6I8M646_9FUSO|nr:F0F1 ATP synthase subunit B [Oceanivirga miroungae]VWL84892.1 ATP synthase F0 subunit beta [Oceanivirga miroungae]